MYLLRGCIPMLVSKRSPSSRLLMTTTTRQICLTTRPTLFAKQQDEKASSSSFWESLGPDKQMYFMTEVQNLPNSLSSPETLRTRFPTLQLSVSRSQSLWHFLLDRSNFSSRDVFRRADPSALKELDTVGAVLLQEKQVGLILEQ